LTNGFLFYHASMGRYENRKQDFGANTRLIHSIIKPNCVYS
jgi:hypothetical protein